MIQEDKDLLLKDLCARLPYGVICKGVQVCSYGEHEAFGKLDSVDRNFSVYIDDYYCDINTVKPYLRPMSSMTEEEREEIEVFICGEWFIEDTGCATKVDREGFIEFLANYDCSGIYPEFCGEYIDWLNAHHFDYHNLIEKGLALEASVDMYKTE